MRAGGGGGGHWRPFSNPPPPPFRGHVTGNPNGLTGIPDGPPGDVFWGGGGGPEVPQHIWLEMIPTMR